MRVNLAIVGAGAKAAAIAAKAECLNRSKSADISITLFERGELANSWAGNGGYSNGDQPLCTPAERDVGFPYDSVFGSHVIEVMQAEYSWMAHAVRNSNVIYSDWIDRGGRRPSHREFASYLRYVMTRSGATMHEGFDVRDLLVQNGKWTVVARATRGDAQRSFGPFDGVIITGPGPARRVFDPVRDQALFDGEDVWRRLDQLRGILNQSSEPIVIVGGGGAAAAIAGWLISSNSVHREIIFVARQATLYTRTGGYFENRVFDDEELWSRLGPSEQIEFVNRITRGVVWEAVADKLASATGITLVPGRARSISIPTTRPGELHMLTVVVTPAASVPYSVEVEGCAVIDASGFDRWRFAKLLPGAWKTETDENLESMATRVDYNLRFPASGLPPIHTPVVSHAAGPGFSSLMNLGRMADRILAPYVAI